MNPFAPLSNRNAAHNAKSHVMPGTLSSSQNLDALLKNETLLNSISDAVICTDLNLRVIYFNNNAARTYGIEPSEILGHSFTEIIRYEYQDDTSASVLHRLFKYGNWQGKVIYCRKDGKRLFLLASVSFAKNEAGTRIGIVSTIKDITGEETIREKARHYETSLNVILNNTREALFLTDCDYNILLFNQNAVEMIKKISSSEMKAGTNLADLLPAYRKQPLQQALATLLKGEPVEYEVLYHCKTWLLINQVPVRDACGNIFEICISARDITQRKINEEHIRQGKEQYRSLVESLSEGVVFLTPDKKILAINKSAEQILQVNREDVLQKGFAESFRNIVDEDGHKTSLTELINTSQGDAVCRQRIIGLQNRYPQKWLQLNTAFVYDTLTREPNAIVLSFTDITEQQRVLQEVEILSMLARETSNGVIILDMKGYITWVNNGFTRLNGYTGEEAIGKHPSLLLTGPESNTAILAELEYHVKNGLPYSCEIASYKKGGEIIWLQLSMQPIRNKKGQVTCYFCIQTDLTEQKRSIEEMKILSLVAKETSNSILIFDMGDATVWINDGFTRLTGYQQQDILGKNPAKVLSGPETDREMLHYMTRKIIAKEPFSGDILIYTKSGQKRWHQVNAQPIRNATGEVTKYFAIATDISEQKKVMQEMEILSLVAKETMNGVIIMDANEHIVWVNDGFVRLNGYSRDEVIGKHPAKLLTGAGTDIKLTEQFGIAGKKEQPFSCEIKSYTKDGQKKWMRVDMHPIKDEKGSITRYCTIQTDVSERYHMQEMLLAEKVKQQKEISRVILKTQEAERNELGRELHDNINQILAAVQLQLGFVKDHYSEGEEIVAKSYSNMHEVIREVRRLCHGLVIPRFSESSFKNELQKLIDNINQEKTFFLHADRLDEKIIPEDIQVSLYRIIQEQLNNVLKHANARETIITLYNDDKTVHLSVEDNGVGTDITDTKKTKSGIGIINILNRVESYNGDAQIITAPGKGYRLLVSIPLI